MDGSVLYEIGHGVAHIYYVLGGIPDGVVLRIGICRNEYSTRMSYAPCENALLQATLQTNTIPSVPNKYTTVMARTKGYSPTTTGSL